MKFLLDENVHRGLFSFLIKLGHDVKLSPKGFANGQVFGLAIEEKRILISRDGDFLNTSIYSSSKHSGIFLIRIAPGDLETQKKSISDLLKKFPEVDNFKGKAVILFPENFKFQEKQS